MSIAIILATYTQTPLIRLYPNSYGQPIYGEQADSLIRIVVLQKECIYTSAKMLVCMAMHLLPAASVASPSNALLSRVYMQE